MAGITKRSRACAFAMLSLPLAISCSKDAPTVPLGAEASGALLTAADSAAALATQTQNGIRASLSAVVTSITLNAGESVVITVQSTECSGNPETVKVYGVIAGVVTSGICTALAGTQVTMGPATANGTISFRATHEFYGEGPAGQVSGGSPEYTVGMNDGYGDTDYNDVILSVRVICPAANDPILDHPDFRSRYDSLMTLSKITNPNPAARIEWGLFVYEDSTAFGGLQIGWPEFTSNLSCKVAVPAPQQSLPVRAIVHSHPRFFKENVKIACNDSTAKPYNARANGGGSDADWEYATNFGVTVYAAGPQWTHRLTPGVPKKDRNKNTFRWKKTINGCWNKSP